MMGVYIKNMKMPISCANCPLRCYDHDDQKFCGATGNSIIFGLSRPDFCPLIEIPPHGRLIDVDMAYDEFLNLMEIQGVIDPCQLGRILVCAPTIIEADSGET